MSDLVKRDEDMIAEYGEGPLGFEDDSSDDLIIPRVKIIQTLSPERRDKLADEGDIINSLTAERLNGKIFVPVFKFNSNIEWIDRSAGGGIACHARDGRNGVEQDGTTKVCAMCRRNEFDNTKQGREAIPKCTKYINFFGFFENERAPIILSFSKTNYNEGKKLYSLAKVSMQNMWHNGYKLTEKLISRNSNEWYNIQVSANGQVSDEDKAFGMQLFKEFRRSSVVFDLDESEGSGTAPASNVDIDSTEF